jgi:hypothetical protein
VAEDPGGFNSYSRSKNSETNNSPAITNGSHHSANNNYNNSINYNNSNNNNNSISHGNLRSSGSTLTLKSTAKKLSATAPAALTKHKLVA